MPSSVANASASPVAPNAANDTDGTWAATTVRSPWDTTTGSSASTPLLCNVANGSMSLAPPLVYDPTLPTPPTSRPSAPNPDDTTV